MRRQVPISNEFPYHVSGRTPNREFFKLPMDETWQIMEEYLYLTKKIYDLRIHAFVLMSNHYHLMCSTPYLNIGPAMNYFNGENSRAMNLISGRTNQNWGRRYHKTLVNSYHYYMNVYKYIYRNPVRAGLCMTVEDYKYSTLSGLCGKTQLIIPVEEDTILFDPYFTTKNLKWLNTPSCPQDELAVKNALRKNMFKLPTDPISGYKSHLEIDLL